MNHIDDNNIQNPDELEMLRAQVAEFKNRLDEQEIVNDRLLRDVVRGKVKSLRSFNITVYLLAAVGLLLILAAFIVARVSVWPVVVLGLLAVAEVVFSFWNLGKISRVSEMSVVDAQTEMTAFVRREKWLNIIEIPFVVLIVVWAYHAFESVVIPDSVPRDLIEDTARGGFVGVIIGVAVVIGIFAKQIRMIRNIRRSISALKDEL